MQYRSAVAPSTLGVELVDGGVVVRYLDGREVFYHGPPERVEGGVTTPPGKDVHVLVTDEAGVEGVMTYVNDRDTHDDVLESTGVGRVFVGPDETTTVFPGVAVTLAGYSIEVTVQEGAIDGRVFVFAEDAASEHAYEVDP